MSDQYNIFNTYAKKICEMNRFFNFVKSKNVKGMVVMSYFFFNLKDFCGINTKFGSTQDRKVIKS